MHGARRRLTLLVAAGAVAAPPALIAASGLSWGVGELIAAEVVYWWCVGAAVAHHKLTPRIGRWTASALLGTVAALSFAPLALADDMCSESLRSPYCQRTVGAWMIAGLAAVASMVVAGVAARTPKALRGAVQRLWRARRHTDPHDRRRDKQSSQHQARAAGSGASRRTQGRQPVERRRKRRR